MWPYAYSMPIAVRYTKDTFLFFFSSRRRHTRCLSDWSSDVCSSDLVLDAEEAACAEPALRQFRDDGADADGAGVKDADDGVVRQPGLVAHKRDEQANDRSEEHTSELQSLRHLVCRLLLEKKNKILTQ